jgi:hypothetical protein
MMGLDRFRELLDAYGAEPGRWPAQERPAAEALLAGKPEAAEMLAKALSVDALLDRATPLSPPIIDAEALIGRITAEPQSQVLAFQPVARRQGASFALKVASLAAAAAIGFLVGATQFMDSVDSSSQPSSVALADVLPW